MMYMFRGQLSAEIAPGFSEPLPDATIRLYTYRGTKYVSGLAVADPSTPLTMMSPDAMQAKKSAFITETTTDAEGKFSIALDEESGYRGEACEIDLFLTSVPGRKSQAPNLPVQIPLTTIRLRAQGPAEEPAAIWRYCLPADFWCEVRAHFDAWVICGRVLAPAQPIGSVRVTAFDADWVQDDVMGSAFTDSEGKFRIDYERAAFTRTPLSPIINMEEGGPDLYFKVDTPGGSVLLKEPRAHGQRAERKNAGHCFLIELNLETAPA